METKHTPGPWKAEFYEATNIRAPHGGLVAQAHHLMGRFGALGRVPAPEVEANAHLIAAAPEMLAALKAITAAFNVFRLKPEGAPGSAVRAIQDMQISAMDDAHSAIAKAEGGAS